MFIPWWRSVSFHLGLVDSKTALNRMRLMTSPCFTPFCIAISFPWWRQPVCCWYRPSRSEQYGLGTPCHSTFRKRDRTQHDQRVWSNQGLQTTMAYSSLNICQVTIRKQNNIINSGSSPGLFDSCAGARPQNHAVWSLLFCSVWGCTWHCILITFCIQCFPSMLARRPSNNAMTRNHVIVATVHATCWFLFCSNAFKD